MPVGTSATHLRGVAFLAAAGITYEVIAAACSSPQTAEINAHSRAETLMKWVNVGLIEGAILVCVALAVDKKYRAPILLGALAEALITWFEYQHAKLSGLRSDEPSTES